eukprot:2391801-Prymnesium_polylepis.1
MPSTCRSPARTGCCSSCPRFANCVQCKDLAALWAAQSSEPSALGPLDHRAGHCSRRIRGPCIVQCHAVLL